MHSLKRIFLLFACIMAQYCYSLDLAEHHQLLIVTTSNWDEKQGELRLYERVSDVSNWVSIRTIPVVIGRAGLAWGIGLHPADTKMMPCKKEGDGKSPAGIFSLGSAFGFASDSEMDHLQMDYFQINPYIEAVDDPLSHYYNQIVDIRAVIPDWRSSEKMSDVPLYAMGIVINHNFPNSQLDAGSAIFFHLWHQKDSGTAGCTAMSQEDLSIIMRWLDRNKNPILVQLPIHEYDERQHVWNLPELRVLSAIIHAICLNH